MTALFRAPKPTERKQPKAAIERKISPKAKPERVSDNLLVETADPYLLDDSEIRLESVEE